MLFFWSLLCLQQGGTSEPPPAVPVTVRWRVSMPLLSLWSGKTNNGCRSPSRGAFSSLSSNLNPKQVTLFIFIWTAAGLKKSQNFPSGKECVCNATFPCRREIFSHVKHNIFPLKSAYIPPNLSFPTFKQKISFPVLTWQRAELNNHQVLHCYRQRPETPPGVSPLT